MVWWTSQPGEYVSKYVLVIAHAPRRTNPHACFATRERIFITLIEKDPKPRIARFAI